MQIQPKHILSTLLVATIACWSLVFYFSGNKYKQHSYTSDIEKLQTTIEQQIQASTQLPQETPQLIEKIKQIHKTYPTCHFQVLEKGKPIYWTSNTISFPAEKDIINKKPHLQRLKNGWYIVKKQEQKNKTIITCLLLKYDYSYENPHLKNNFPVNYHLSQQYDLTRQLPIEAINNYYKVTLKDYGITFYLLANPKNFSYSNTVLLLGFISIILLFLSIDFTFKNYLPHQPIFVFLELILIIMARVLFQVSKQPDVLYLQDLFTPKYFAVSGFLPSLGDLILTVIVAVFVVKIIIQTLSKSERKHVVVNLSFLVFKQLFALAAPILSYHLIYNSTLHFNLSQIYELSWYSILAMISVLVLFGLYFFLVLKWFGEIKKMWLFISIAINIVSFLVLNYYIEHLLYYFIIISIFEIIIYFHYQNKSYFSAYFSLFSLIILSLTISVTIIVLSNDEEHTERKFLAEKLINDKDPIAEYLFISIAENIKKDSKITQLIDRYWLDDNKPLIDEYITKKYFNGYWEKFDINIVVCNDDDSLLIALDNEEVHCSTFFQNRIAQSPDFYFSPPAPIYFVNDENGVIYIADLPVHDIRNITYHLYIEFYYKIFPKTEGYPELLLSNKQLKQTISFGGYDFAKYKNGNLINQSGEYNYSTQIDSIYINKHKNTFYIEDGYSHFLFSEGNNTIIISKPATTKIDDLSVFSYVFILLGILFLVGYIVLDSNGKLTLNLQSFNTKIQFFVIANIFIAFVLIAIGTVYYIQNQYTQTNLTNINEKIQSVLVEVEDKLGEEEQLSETHQEMMNYYLTKFSNVFYTDINLYKTNGELFATSRPEIFNNGLLNHLMPYDVYQALTIQHKSEYVHQEKIGNLSYLSAYVPFRNFKNNVLAYLNLPYFSKQHALEKELSTFYIALINIYVLIFVLSIILAVIFANYLSKPLRLIKSTISNLQIGKTNELIEWHTNDELGELIQEYNKKVLELEKSARLLAKSERESAWREMAKQVAHEIKNPLTPMKLSIQHLQRIASNDDELKEKINKTAEILIEQIDTLATIATEFSNFAKLPEPNYENIDVLKIANDTANLFKEENITIQLTNNTGKNQVFINADKDQMIRIFNNLIKNAIQSVAPGKTPDISIEIKLVNNHVVIAIADNGEGIPHTMQQNIFEPNFTTKTGGMGLGLAMVKNFTESFGGKIWFTSTQGKGTTFYLSFPEKN